MNAIFSRSIKDRDGGNLLQASANIIQIFWQRWEVGFKKKTLYHSLKNLFCHCNLSFKQSFHSEKPIGLPKYSILIFYHALFSTLIKEVGWGGFRGKLQVSRQWVLCMLGEWCVKTVTPVDITLWFLTLVILCLCTVNLNL